MGRQTLEIEFNVPDGYEFTGEIRPPKKGEPNLTLENRRNLESGIFNVAGHDFDLESRIILRKTWEAPSWIPDGVWVYRHAALGWCISKTEPVDSKVAEGHYIVRYGKFVCLQPLMDIVGEIPMPPVNKVQVKRD